MLALLDGDIIAYQAAAGAEEHFDWGDGEQSTLLNTEQAIQSALNTVTDWTDRAGCESCIIAFSGERNFRKFIAPTGYKTNRKPKPEAYWWTVEALKDAHKTVTVDGLEADDVLGIMHTGQYDGRSVIVTIDKDLRTVPGVHFNPDKDDKPVSTSPSQADRTWLIQTLTGDSTDGYKGIPGTGPKRAEAILKDAPQWAAVAAAYHKAGLPESIAIQQARLARILRRGDYNKERKEILLWHPTNPESLTLATVCGAS